MLLEEYFALIEEDSSLVDDITELTKILEEESTNYFWKKNYHFIYKYKDSSYTWSKKLQRLTTKKSNRSE